MRRSLSCGSDGAITAALSNITGAAVSPVFIANQGGGGAISASRDDKGKTWSLGAQYDVASGVMAYVTSGSGYKDGGFNSRSAVVTPFAFDPETSLTYEAGVKSTLFDHRLVLVGHGDDRNTRGKAAERRAIGLAGLRIHDDFSLGHGSGRPLQRGIPHVGEPGLRRNRILTPWDYG